MADASLPPPVAIPAAARVGLRGGSLTLAETLGQSIAGISPSLMPALNISVVAALAGGGSWITYAIAAAAMLVVGANISTLAKRHPLAGSYFLYIGRVLGSFAGMIAGWSMLSAYVITGVAVAASFCIFLDNMMTAFGWPTLAPPPWLSVLLFTAITGLAAYRDVRLSARLGLALEAVSIGMVTLILGVVLVRHGGVVDPRQLDVSHIKLGGVTSALTLAVFSFVGFESAATLAQESASPQRDIPLAVNISSGFSGLFFVGATYVMILGMTGGASALGASASPLVDMTAQAGMRWAAGLVYGAATISVCACGIASINAASRILYSMGRYQFVHGSFGVVHGTHRTPHRAILATTGFLGSITLGLVSRFGVLDAYGYAGTFATFGFLVIYLLICVVSPLDLRRAGLLKLHHGLLAALGLALMIFVVVGSLYPVPPHPYELLPYLFAGFLALGAAWFVYLRWRAPQALQTMRHDMEAAE